MTNLIALKTYRYAKKPLKHGDTFTARDDHAKLLVALGKAKIAETAPAIVTAAIQAETDSTTDIPKRRPYRRRDLTAEPSE